MEPRARRADSLLSRPALLAGNSRAPRCAASGRGNVHRGADRAACRARETAPGWADRGRASLRAQVPCTCRGRCFSGHHPPPCCASPDADKMVVVPPAAFLRVECVLSEGADAGCPKSGSMIRGLCCAFLHILSRGPMRVASQPVRVGPTEALPSRRELWRRGLAELRSIKAACRARARVCVRCVRGGIVLTRSVSPCRVSVLRV